MNTILEALARIDLGREAAPILNFTREFNSFGDGSRVFILISTYNAPDIANEFYRLKESGYDALWIIPAEYDTVITEAVDCNDPKIVKWEVSKDE